MSLSHMILNPSVKAAAVLYCIFYLCFTSESLAQLPPAFKGISAQNVEKDDRTRVYLTAKRILWKSDVSGNYIVSDENLLKPGKGQAALVNSGLTILRNDQAIKSGLLLDFGKEIQGGLQLVTGLMKSKNPVKVRIRFGESASEAMSDIDTIKGATNDHAMRDFVVDLPWLGTLEIGNTGFRFVRIDLVDASTELLLKEVRAIFTYRDIPYLGSFKSSDERLNSIWATGAYTVHLNMQQYLWDGIKRDRLVWVGDMHPEMMTIASVFGNHEIVPNSLDLARDQTPLPGWMNGISSYSMWWILLHRDWYKFQGDRKYLKQQQTYLTGLLNQLITKIDKNGSENLDGGRFLDWPSSENKPAIHAGLQAMMIMSLTAGAELTILLGDPNTAKKCNEAVLRLKQNIPTTNNSKQAASLLALAGVLPAQRANTEVIAVGGVKNYSTFYGYYMLQAKAKAGDYQGAIDNIREYWGAMLDLGATTFWEDFNMDWLPNASRIDELVPDGKKDIHGDYGAYCYKGFRHSLCHGWASGPTAWLTEHVLGVHITALGSKEITLTPHLGDLKYVEGTFPTPYGLVWIKHTKLANGQIKTEVKGPSQVKIIKKG